MGYPSNYIKKGGYEEHVIVQNDASYCAQGEMGHQGVHDLSLRLLFCFGRIVVYTVRL